MFWLRNKKISFLLHTLNLSPGLEILFRNIESLNYRELDIRIYSPPKSYYDHFLSLSNICFECIKETSPLKHLKHMFL